MIREGGSPKSNAPWLRGCMVPCTADHDTCVRLCVVPCYVCGKKPDDMKSNDACGGAHGASANYSLTGCPSGSACWVMSIPRVGCCNPAPLPPSTEPPPPPAPPPPPPPPLHSSPPLQPTLPPPSHRLLSLTRLPLTPPPPPPLVMMYCDFRLGRWWNHNMHYTNMMVTLHLT